MPQEPLSGGLFVVLVVFRGVQVLFVDANPPSHLTVSYLWKSLQVGNFSSAWGSFTTLAKQTMNSSVTPLIPLGSSLSGSLPSPVSSSS